MNTIALSPSFPVSLWRRWSEPLERWFTAPRRTPHRAQLELSLHGLDDIGAPPEWRRDVESRERAGQLERDTLRLYGVHAASGLHR